MLQTMLLLSTMVLQAAASVPNEPYRLALAPSQTIASASTPDARTVVVVGRNGDGGVWRLAGKSTNLRWIEAFAPPFLRGNPDGSDGVDLALSHDGKRAAFLQGGRLRFYTLNPMRLLSTQRVGYGSHKVEWLPSGGGVLVTSNYEKARLYHLESAGVTLPIQPPFAFSKGERTVFGLGPQGIVQEVDLATGKVKRRLRDRLSSYAPLALSPDGRYLISGGEDPSWTGPGLGPEGGAPTESAYVRELTLKVWDLRTGKRLRLLPGYMSTVDRPEVVFDAAGHAVFLGLGRSVNVHTGKVVAKFEEGNTPYGAFLRVTDPKRPWIRQPIRLPSPPLWASAAAFSRDGSKLYLGGREGRTGTLLTWDLGKGELIRRLAFPHPNINAIGELANGRLVVNGGQYAWVLGSRGKLLRRVESPTSDELGMSHQEWISIDPVGRRAYATVGMGEARLDVIDVNSGKVLERRSRASRPRPDAFSPDGTRYLAYRMRTAEKGGVTIDLVCVDAHSGRELWNRSDLRWESASFSPDGRSIVASGNLQRNIADPDRPVLAVLNAQTGATIRQVAVRERIWQVRFAPNGQEVCFASEAGLQWRAAEDLDRISSRIVASFSDATIGWAMSPDNDLVAVSRPDSSVRLFSKKLGRAVAVLNALPQSGWVAWTNDGALHGSPNGLGIVRSSTGQSFFQSSTVPWAVTHP